jgi:hypothetical protein
LEYLELNKTYDKQIKNIPSNLKTIKCNINYKYVDLFKGIDIEYYD